MDNKKRQNLIIWSMLVLFALSVIYLFYSAQRPLASEWWAVYFENPKNDNLNFVIENHSNKTDFNYEVWKDSEKLLTRETNCSKNDSCLIELDSQNVIGKISVKVLQGDRLKDIYKNLGK